MRPSTAGFLASCARASTPSAGRPVRLSFPTREEDPVNPEVTAFFDEATFTVSYVVSDPAGHSAAIIDSVLDFGSARTAFRALITSSLPAITPNAEI